jgi:chromosome segregation ATPase
LFWFLGVLFGAGVIVVRRYRQVATPAIDPPTSAERRHDQQDDGEAHPEDPQPPIDASVPPPRIADLGRATVRGGWLLMLQRGLRKSRFRVLMSGYDRDQVDTVVQEYERRRHEWSNKRVQNSSTQAQADRRVRELEAKVAELEDGAGRSPLPAGLVEFLDQSFAQLGRDARSHAISAVEAERDTLTHTREIVESARAQAEAVVANAERERDDVSRSVDESRQQVDQYLQASKILAEDRARAVREKGTDRLREPVFELERTHEQQRMVIKELAELQELIDTSWRRVISE